MDDFAGERAEPPYPRGRGRRDLRSLLDFIQLVRCTAVQIVVRVVTTAVLLVLFADIAIKFS